MCDSVSICDRQMFNLNSEFKQNINLSSILSLLFHISLFKVTRLLLVDEVSQQVPEQNSSIQYQDKTEVITEPSPQQSHEECFPVLSGTFRSYQTVEGRLHSESLSRLYF